MKECDISGGSKHTLTPPTYFQGVRTLPTPMIYAHGCIEIRLQLFSLSVSLPLSLSPVTHATHTKQLDHIVSSLVVVKRTLIYLQRNRSHLLVFQWQSRDVELTSA